MNKLNTVIFWGALWGILEASLGWFLHLIHFKGEAIVLYPFGVICMLMAVKQTAQTSAAIKVAGVAAIVKLINLFMEPAVPAFHITNPAMAIFLEGLATWGYCIYIAKKPFSWKTAIPVATLTIFASLLLFKGWQIGMDAFVTYNPAAHKPVGINTFLEWGGRALIQGTMLVALSFLVNRIPFTINIAKWTSRLAVPSLVIAVVLNVLI